MANAKAVYLDQNVYGHMLAAGPWSTHALGLLLKAAVDAGDAEVWVSPTNVLETALCGDPILRSKLAGAMLDLCQARRMRAGCCTGSA